MFELIVNILLFVFLGFSFFTHVLEAAVPANVLKNPYTFKPDVWPKAIIILLEICLIVNIIQILRKNKGNPDFTLAAFGGHCVEFFKSNLFKGILIMAVASMILDPLGFLVTAFLVLFLYGMLLGDRNYVRLAIVSVIIAFILHIIFNGMLSVTLPRGTGFLRSFSLFVESIYGAVKNIF